MAAPWLGSLPPAQEARVLARPAACLGDRDKEEPRQGPEPACHTS